MVVEGLVNEKLKVASCEKKDSAMQTEVEMSWSLIAAAGQR